MRRHLNRFNPAVLLTGIWLVAPDLVQACSTCLGAPDDPVVLGIKVAMFSMLGVTGGVLGGFATFMIYLHKKSKALAAADAASD